jgi:hypothetical protein
VRRPGRPDGAALTAGLALVALGTVLLQDRAGAQRLDFGAAAPIVFAAIGAILLAGGLSRRG